MERPTWTGNITFGLVNVPVSLYSGEERVDISFRLLDSRDHARIRYERINEVTGKEVPWDQTVKGYEYEDDKYVLLTDEELKNVAIESTKTVEIEDFVDLRSIPLPYFDKPYILVPSKAGRKPYVLLREVLKKTNMAGIAKVVIRTRQYLSVVLPEKDALLLCILRFSNELRDPAEYPIPEGGAAENNITARELEIATQLVRSMEAKWNPDQYHDEYQATLHEWIKKKIGNQGKAPRLESKKQSKPMGKIIDIMELLKQSVEQRSKRASKSDEPSVPDKKKSNVTKLRPAAKKSSVHAKAAAARRSAPSRKAAS